ncbi:hypothetical protein MMPV_001223 [Pyropia vietnamensis]
MADRSRIRYRIHPPSSPLPPAVATAAASSVLFPQHIQLLVPLPLVAPQTGLAVCSPSPLPAPPPPPSQPYYYTLVRDLPLTALLSPAVHAANPGLAVLPLAAALDRANTFCVTPLSPPLLRLSLDKDTYVELGLVGERKLRGDHPVMTAGRRYAVDVPLPVKSAKVDARLRWALGRDRLGGVDVVMCSTGGTAAGVTLPPGLGVDAPGGDTTVYPCEVTTVTSEAGPVVDAARLLRDAASGVGRGDALAELIDWLGVAATGGVAAAAALLGPTATDDKEGVAPPELPSPAEPSPFAFDYATALAAPHALRTTTTTGFLHPSAAAAAADVAVATVATGAAPWAAVTVMGVPDAPLLFRPGGVDRSCGPAPAAGAWGGDGGVVVLVVRGGGGVVATLLSNCDM